MAMFKTNAYREENQRVMQYLLMSAVHVETALYISAEHTLKFSGFERWIIPNTVTATVAMNGDPIVYLPFPCVENPNRHATVALTATGLPLWCGTPQLSDDVTRYRLLQSLLQVFAVYENSELQHIVDGLQRGTIALNGDGTIWYPMTWDHTPAYIALICELQSIMAGLERHAVAVLTPAGSNVSTGTIDLVQRQIRTLLATFDGVLARPDTYPVCGKEINETIAAIRAHVIQGLPAYPGLHTLAEILEDHCWTVDKHVKQVQ